MHPERKAMKPTDEKAQQKQTKSEQALAAVRDAARERPFEFSHDNQSRGWACIPVRNHIECYAIRSREFKLQVRKILFERLGEAPKKLVNECIEHCETVAVCGSPTTSPAW